MMMGHLWWNAGCGWSSAGLSSIRLTTDQRQMIEEQRRMLDEILAELDAGEETETVAGVTAPLDHRRLRGIPPWGVA
jgi:hypothetical protein